MKNILRYWKKERENGQQRQAKTITYFLLQIF